MSISSVLGSAFEILVSVHFNELSIFDMLVHDGFEGVLFTSVFPVLVPDAENEESALLHGWQHPFKYLWRAVAGSHSTDNGHEIGGKLQFLG